MIDRLNIESRICRFDHDPCFPWDFRKEVIRPPWRLELSKYSKLSDGNEAALEVERWTMRSWEVGLIEHTSTCWKEFVTANNGYKDLGTGRKIWIWRKKTKCRPKKIKRRPSMAVTGGAQAWNLSQAIFKTLSKKAEIEERGEGRKEERERKSRWRRKKERRMKGESQKRNEDKENSNLVLSWRQKLLFQN